MFAVALAAVSLAVGGEGVSARRQENALMAAARAYVPAPPKFSVVYDGGAGYDPGSTDAQSVGQYADTNPGQMVVHTTRGFSKRRIAQDVGQIFGYSVLRPGDRNYFSRLLGTDPAYWTDVHSNSPTGTAREAGDEAFANYYALAATGGLGRGESVAWGNTSIDPRRLRQFSSALARLGHRNHLAPLDLAKALTDAR